MLNKIKNHRKYSYELVKINAKFKRHHFLILKLNNMQKKIYANVCLIDQHHLA